jgi:hypothetical protein
MAGVAARAIAAAPAIVAATDGLICCDNFA